MLEHRMGADLSGVRVHSDGRAQAAAAALNARAFTHGRNIWLGRGQSASDLRLMAHEATHVVQQGALPQAAAPGAASRGGVQAARSGAMGAGAALGVGAAVGTGAAVGAGPAVVQRDLLDDIGSVAGEAWEATGGRAVEAVGEAGSAIAEAGAEVFWSTLEEVAPRFVPILREIADKGILGFLRDRLARAFDALFGGVADNGGVLATLLTLFSTVFGRVRTIVAALAGGDCEPLIQAVNALKETLTELAGEAWNAITEFFEPIGAFFSDLWNAYGAPVMDWLRDLGGEVWQFLQDLGADIWAWTQPVRDAFGSAWTWVKEQLGIGSGEGDSEGGITSWISEKAGEAWDWMKEQMRPVIEPVQNVLQKVREILPLDAILNLRETIQGWLNDAGSMVDAMEQPDDVVENQGSLRDVILPAILQTVQNLRDGIVQAGQWVAQKIGGLGETVTGFMASLSDNPILGAFRGALAWVQDGVTRLVAWAQETVAGVFAAIGDGLVWLAQWIRPVLDTLQRLAGVVMDLAGRLPDLILGPFWRMIPACIREPIKNFILNQVLARIPVFAQLLQIPDLWARLQETAMRILRDIFVNGNLVRAAWTFFRTMLELLGLPADLIPRLIRNVVSAMSDVLADPFGFLMNLLRSMREGFVRFFGNVGTHLLGGVAGWLFGQLREAGITPPTDFSLRSILGFVLQVLDLTVDRIFERLARRIGPERAAMLRRAVDVATGALAWIADLIREGPAALWRHLQEQLGNLWDLVLNGIIGWLQQTIIVRVTARLLTMLDPSGVMAVVNSIIAIYRAIQSAMEYMRQMLEIVNTVTESAATIARGVIEQAAAFLEGALARAIPVAIGFLANQVGLRGLGARIREMVEGIRERVNQALDWLIDRVVRGGAALLRAFGGGGGASAAAAATQAETTAPDAQNVDRAFRLGEEHHVLRAHVENGRLTFFMASEVFRVFFEQIDFFRQVYIRDIRMSRSTTPEVQRLREQAGAIDARFTAIETEARTIQANYDAATSGEDKERIMFRGIRDLERMLVTAGDDFDLPFLRRVEQRTEHRYAASPLDRWQRATGVEADLSINSPSRPTSPSVDPAGISILSGYQRGHLLAASLGGPNDDLRNFAPMTGATNTRATGMQGPEQVARNAITQSDTLLLYRVAARYRDSHTPLEDWLISHMGATPGAAVALFGLARDNTLSNGEISRALGVPLQTVEDNRDLLMRKLAYYFMPHEFVVSLSLERGTTPIPSGMQNLPIRNHQGALQVPIP